MQKNRARYGQMPRTRDKGPGSCPTPCSSASGPGGFPTGPPEPVTGPDVSTGRVGDERRTGKLTPGVFLSGTKVFQARGSLGAPARGADGYPTEPDRGTGLRLAFFQSSREIGSSSVGSMPKGTLPSLSPTSVRTRSEISIMSSRFSARKVLAFSRPWPSCSPS